MPSGCLLKTNVYLDLWPVFLLSLFFDTELNELFACLEMNKLFLNLIITISPHLRIVFFFRVSLAVQKLLRLMRLLLLSFIFHFSKSETMKFAVISKPVLPIFFSRSLEYPLLHLGL